MAFPQVKTVASIKQLYAMFKHNVVSSPIKMVINVILKGLHAQNMCNILSVLVYIRWIDAIEQMSQMKLKGFS